MTRGLGLLADEVAAAPIDTEAVIATAAARIRNRAVLTAALATIVLVSALVLTLGAAKPDRVPVATPEPSTTSTAGLPSASPEEQAVRAARLQQSITSAFGRILPAGWRHSTFDWGCDYFHCWALGDVIDDVGTISMGLSASGSDPTVMCRVPDCTTKVLDDGTSVAFSKYETTGLQNEPQTRYSVSALRPDGRAIGIDAWWPRDRQAPALTDEQWLEFATAFTY